MRIAEREPGDVSRLRSLVRRERDAARRDRLRATLLALEGHEACEIAETLGRPRRQVQVWAYAYRDGGPTFDWAIHPPPRPGRRAFLPREREDELRARLDAGPRPEDGVCTLRGRDVVRILEAEFGVRYSLTGAHELLHRLGYSCLSPRPRHEKRDLARQARFRKRAPLL